MTTTDYEFELDARAGIEQAQETIDVTWADGRTQHLRLHDYDDVYAIPGLYEAVVQDRLQCVSPAFIAQGLVDAAAQRGTAPGDLRVFDLGAGNGVSGEALRDAGVGTLAGLDASSAAIAALERDRPGLYARFLGQPLEDCFADALQIVSELELNALTAAGAIGFGHIPIDTLLELWAGYGPGALFSATLPAQLKDVPDSDLELLLAGMRADEARTEILSLDAFTHRLTMAGVPIEYLRLVARRT